MTQEQLDKSLLRFCKIGDLEMVKYLVDKGANVHTNNDYPLQLAAAKGYLEVVKYLIDKGANIRADNDGPLCWAATNGKLEVVKYLVEKGANIHTLLWFYSGYSNLEMIKYLVEKGAFSYQSRPNRLIAV